MIVDLIAMVIGVVSSIIYVGFFAIKVPSLPLTIIVVFVLGLMAYSFYTDMRPSDVASRPRRDM
jgi:hypothetical protein